jgi:DNA ligase-associated metallophosphoesterase
VLHAEWQGESVVLLHQRGLWWPRGGVLFIADPHLGKAATFAAAGIPVPAGAQSSDFQRLDAMLDATEATRLVVLGDFFHAADGRDRATMQAVESWRATRPALAIDVVRGNHDRRAGDPPAAWAMACSGELRVGPFVCRHHPPEAGRACDGPVLAGHLHPAVTLRGSGAASLRLPCFWLGATVGVLPAFGRFTGQATIRPRQGDAIYVVGPDGVLAI